MLTTILAISLLAQHGNREQATTEQDAIRSLATRGTIATQLPPNVNFYTSQWGLGRRTEASSTTTYSWTEAEKLENTRRQMLVNKERATLDYIAKFRMWSMSGKRIIGRLIEFHRNKVHIETTNGTPIIIEIGKLTPMDRCWVYDEQKWRRNRPTTLKRKP